MNLQLDVDQFICPITNLIFRDPVTTDDGTTYEKDAIEEWLTKNKTSPTTGIDVSKKLTGCRIVKNLIDALIKAHPELEEQQYVMSIDKIIETKKYTELQKHKRIDLKYLMDKDVLYVIFKNADIQTAKHLIDNAIDLKCKTSVGSHLIHLICKFSNLEIVKYLFDKDDSVDLEAQNNRGERSIHYACQNTGNLDVIDYLIGRKGVQLECRDKDGWRPIHYVCYFNNPDAIRLIISKGVDLTARITKYGTKDMDYDFVKLIKLKK